MCSWHIMSKTPLVNTGNDTVLSLIRFNRLPEGALFVFVRLDAAVFFIAEAYAAVLDRYLFADTQSTSTLTAARLTQSVRQLNPIAKRRYNQDFRCKHKI